MTSCGHATNPNIFWPQLYTRLSPTGEYEPGLNNQSPSSTESPLVGNPERNVTFNGAIQADVKLSQIGTRKQRRVRLCHNDIMGTIFASRYSGGKSEMTSCFRNIAHALCRN